MGTYQSQEGESKTTNLLNTLSFPTRIGPSIPVRFSSYVYEKLIKANTWNFWIHSRFLLLFHDMIPGYKINYAC